MHYFGLVVLALSSMFLQLANAQVPAAYQLGVQDRLRIHVHEWPLLTGEFVVGAGGAIVLPLIGSVPANGRELEDVANDIRNRVREKGALSEAPETTVEVAQYRPFYILGAVDRPGEYHYRPGMLVLNAVAIAGGIYRPMRTSERGFERETITGRGELRLAAVRRDELKAREIRLRAEAEGLEAFPEPPAKIAGGTQQFLNHEKHIFDSRLDRFRNQYISMGKTVELYENEIKTLHEQIESARKQEASVARELEDTKGLVARSILPAPRILPIERTLAQIEREIKEIGTSITRARQQINLTEIQRLNLKDERRSTALGELQALTTQLKELDERVETALRLISESGGAVASSPTDAADGGMRSSFVIVRNVGDVTRETPAQETTVMQPGDIVKVFSSREQNESQQDRSALGLQRSAFDGN